MPPNRGCFNIIYFTPESPKALLVSLVKLVVSLQIFNEMVAPMIDNWVKENCLSRSKEGLYNLGSRESAARRMIEEAGKYETDGATAAKKKLEKQRRKIAAAGQR